MKCEHNKISEICQYCNKITNISFATTQMFEDKCEKDSHEEIQHNKVYEDFKETLFNASEEVKNDVMRLEFGCVVNNQTGDWLVLEGNRIKNPNGNGNYKDILYCFNWTSCCWLDDFKIIGRPITLEDVLRALGKKYQGRINIDGTGEFTIWEAGEENNLNVYWLLGKSAFDQTDETLIALTNLLK